MNSSNIDSHVRRHIGMPIDLRPPLPPEPNRYKDWSDRDLSKQLAGRFEHLADPNQKEFITLLSLKEAAFNPGRAGVGWEDSQLAKEVLKRGNLMDKLDVDRNGNLDGKIDKENIRLVIRSESAPKLDIVPPRHRPEVYDHFGRPEWLSRLPGVNDGLPGNRFKLNE